MKYIIVGDMHAKLGKLKDIELAFNEIVQLYYDHKCDNIIILGDLLDNKAIVRSECLNFFFDYFKKSEISWRLLIGNHDYHNSKTCEDYSIRPLTKLKNVKIDKAFMIDKYCFLSYDNPDKTLQLIYECPDNSYLFLHQDIEGFTYSSGKEIISPLQMKHLKKFKRVFNGHIHKPAEKGNVIIVGSLMTENFGESGEEKRVCILNTDTDEIQFVKLKTIPTHWSFTFKFHNLKDVRDVVLPPFNSNDQLQIIVEIPTELSNKINKNLFNFPQLVSFKKKIITTKKDIRINETLNKIDMMEVYINSIQTDLDKKELLELNRKIMEKINAD